jgi:hypothetical protein
MTVFQDIMSSSKSIAHSHGTKVRSAVIQKRVEKEHRKENRRRQHRRSNALLLGNVLVEEPLVRANTNDTTFSGPMEIPADAVLSQLLAEVLSDTNNDSNNNSLVINSSMSLPPPSQITPSSSMNNCVSSDEGDEEETLFQCNIDFHLNPLEFVSLKADAVAGNLAKASDNCGNAEGPFTDYHGPMELDVHSHDLVYNTRFEKLKKKVSFAAEVCVLEVPHHSLLSEQQKVQLWNGASVTKNIMARNMIEYVFEGNDWRNAIEEDCFCDFAGEKVHPAHVSSSNSDTASLEGTLPQQDIHLAHEYHPSHHWNESTKSAFPIMESLSCKSTPSDMYFTDRHHEENHTAMMVMMHHIHLQEVANSSHQQHLMIPTSSQTTVPCVPYV